MDSVQDTPIKRRKVDKGYTSGGLSYDLLDDSGDNLFEDYETVATIPLPRQTLNQQHITEKPSSSSAHITQPTQIISRSTDEKPSVVQVAASSPFRVANLSSPVRGRGPVGILANAIAPAGTAFRPPVGITKPPVVNISDDDGPSYRGGSSDEDSQGQDRVDIKPSVFIQSAQKFSEANTTTNREVDHSSKGVTRFKEITSSSFYKPIENNNKARGSTLSNSVYDSRNRDENVTTSRISVPKRSSDIMASAYGGSSRPAKRICQTGPAKALLEPDISLDDIEDYILRQKVERLQMVLPHHSILTIRNSLVAKKGNFDDACELLTSQEEQPQEIDLTVSGDEMSLTRPAKQKKPPAKQQLKAPVQSIQEKWTATQSLLKGSQPLASSPPQTPQKKPRRRLVQGRKNPLPLAKVEVRAKSSSPAPTRNFTPISDASDSGIEIEPERDTEVECKVLNFMNTCSVADLVDIAAISENIAALLLSQKPFRNLNAVRQVTNHTSGGKRKTVKKPIGDKIVDKCIEMWTGYEAVDILVHQCEALGKPVAEEIKKWGVNVFGIAKDGELEVVNFDDVASEVKSEGSMRDSGIGTPISTALSADEHSDVDAKNTLKNRNKKIFSPQPEIMGEDVVLKDYQIVGVNWLSLLFKQKLSCILADDMGLGKTCQVIAFLAHLYEKGVKGPHLIVVPGSTLENWLREFSVFCPTLVVMPYYANLKDRLDIREQIEENLDKLNVIVTTYGMAKAKADNKFLRRLKPVVCVYDEGHILKNSKSAGYVELMRIPAQFRLLLTGTPLQNNLTELACLLGFILPSVFREHSHELEYIFSHKAKTTDESHAALLSTQRIARAKSMMTPFVLRRKKHQVLKHLPAKTRRVEYCELTKSQLDIYESEKARALQIINDRAAGKKTGNETANIMMALRKASIHSLLFRRLYTDKIISKMSKACLKEEEFRESNVDIVYEDMTVMTDFELHGFCERYPSTMSGFPLRNNEWMDSGKVTKLCDLLTAFKSNGDRALVFSQFVMVMNILEAVLESLGIRFFRLDGQTKIDERQGMIDQFHDEEDITVFLLSTKAGGAGINLACANKVVIFDSSFNPQDDIQAENRAHRVGQKREVEVVRLVTRGTIEEQIHALGETKLALDDRVAGDVGTVDDLESKKAEKQGAKVVEGMILRQLKDEEKIGGVTNIKP